VFAQNRNQNGKNMKTIIILLSILLFCGNCSKNKKYAEHLPICNICPDTVNIHDSIQNVYRDTIVENICIKFEFDFCFTNSNKDTIAFGFRFTGGALIIDLINDKEDIVGEIYKGQVSGGNYTIRWPVKGNDEFYGIRLQREDRIDTKWFYLD
jgi:hypothetical protein